MGTYKAQRNENIADEEIMQKSAKQEKQESTEEAVDLIAETALDAYTGGEFSKIKDAAEKVPVLGNVVKNNWDKKVKQISKVASRTPVGDLAKKAKDSGITDAAKSAKGMMSGKGTDSKTGSGLGNLMNKSNNGDFFSRLMGKGSSKDEGNILTKMFNKMPPMLKIKIIVGCSACLLFMLMVYTVFAQDDVTNLALTNGSTMSSTNINGASDLIGGLETVGTWYIENVSVYDQSLYVQSPFAVAKVRADCTGFAVAYMSYIAGADVPDSYSGEMVYPDGNWAKTVDALGWKAYSSDEIDTLRPGDVLIAHSGSLYSTKGQHAEIYVDETHTFGWGSAKTAYPTSNTISMSKFGGHTHFMDSTHDYITIYRFEGELSSSSSSGSSSLNAQKMNDSSFNHGTKSKSNQKYIMLHDTEMPQDAKTVVNSWKNSGNGVAAHFVVDRDGTIIQAVELDTITHHAGWGGPGDYDSKFGVGNNDGKGNGDDLVGTSKVGYDSYTSYGMNSYSIGIEMCHVNGEDYPEALLNSVDKIIQYIDSYYGFQSTIIDHKAWRPSNSDTDAKFATYLSNYQTLRHH